MLTKTVPQPMQIGTATYGRTNRLDGRPGPECPKSTTIGLQHDRQAPSTALVVGGAR